MILLSISAHFSEAEYRACVDIIIVAVESLANLNLSMT